MIQMLASVTNLQEAMMVLEADVDIIDLKNPKLGALGAISLEDVSEVVRHINGKKMVSATIGDLPMNSSLIVSAAEKMAKTGVDIIKVGFFGHHQHEHCINELKSLTKNGIRIVAVLFADQQPDVELLDILKKAGFYGAMLDTANKNGQSLVDYMIYNDLQRFVQEAHTINLKFGLAGSLGLAHIGDLCYLKPDYLGFRGALCQQKQRINNLDPENILAVKTMLHNCNTLDAEACLD